MSDSDLGSTGTGTSPEVDHAILASTSVKVEKEVSITTAARDPNGGGTLLPAGTILTKITSGGDSGLYKEYEDGASDGSQNEGTAVALQHPVDVDDHTNKTVATVYSEATLKADEVNVDTNFDWSAQQNLSKWPQ